MRASFPLFKPLGWIIFAGLLFCGTNSFAQSTRVAVVDMKRIVNAAPQFVAGKQRVIAELAGVERKLRSDEATPPLCHFLTQHVLERVIW